MKLKILLLLSFLCIAASACLHPTYTFLRKSFRTSIQDVLRKVSVTDKLKNFFRRLGLRGALRRVGSRMLADNKILCIICEELVDAIFHELRSGTDQSVLIRLLIKVCDLLKLERYGVCAGFVKLNVNPIVYIATSLRNLTGERVCAIALQEFDCVADFPELNINIPEAKTNNAKRDKQANADPVKILQITDIHYDPHYLVHGLADCPDPLCCQVQTGLTKKRDRAAGYWGDYRKCDVPMHFIDDTLQHIKKKHSDVDYIYFTGDIISHRIWDTTKRNNTVYLREIYAKLREVFSNKPLYPIIGNHESHPTNVFAPRSVTAKNVSTNWVYKELAELWSAWLPKETKETILEGGYYTVLIKPGFRIIALNSNVGYTFNWWVLYETNTMTSHLQWLVDTLYQAEKNGEYVHILSHAPSGDGTCYIPYSFQFWRIIERFSNTITGIFNGHSHWDEYLLYHSSTDPSKPIAVAWNGGSLTTHNDVNPNYKIYMVDRKKFEVLDFESWTFNLTLANLTPKKSPKWFKQYSFKKVNKLKNLSAQAVRDLLVRATRDHSVMEAQYSHKYRDADSREICDTKCMLDELCRTVTMVHGNLTQCADLQDMWK